MPGALPPCVPAALRRGSASGAGTALQRLWLLAAAVALGAGLCAGASVGKAESAAGGAPIAQPFRVVQDAEFAPVRATFDAGMLDTASDPDDHRAGTYAACVNNVVGVARLAAVADPASADNPKRPGIFAWRTAGAAAPGGRFVPYKECAGNMFHPLLP